METKTRLSLMKHLYIEGIQRIYLYFLSFKIINILNGGVIVLMCHILIIHLVNIVYKRFKQR